MKKIKAQETILDIIGVLLIIISMWAYYFNQYSFAESTIIGCVGLALFVLKGSAIRKLVTDLVKAIIKKYLTK